MKTIETLQAEKSKIDFEIAQCKAAIREMTANAKNKGRYAPAKTFNEMQLKASRLGQESQKIQHEIASLNRLSKRESRRLVAELFIDAAKTELPKEQFLRIFEMAHTMANVARAKTETGAA